MQPEVLRDIYEIDIRIEEIDGNRIGLYFALCQPAYQVPQNVGYAPKLSGAAAA